MCEKNSLQWDDYDSREFSKTLLKDKSEHDKELKKEYRRIKRLRDITAHSIPSDKSVRSIIDILRTSLEKLETIIQ